MSEYWLGVLTPFMLIVGVLLLWLLAAVARRVWVSLHRAFSTTIVVKHNLVEFNELVGGEPRSPKPEYWDSANRLRDALLVNPKLRVWAGFGRLFFVARDVQLQPVFDDATREWMDAEDRKQRARVSAGGGGRRG